VKTHKIDPATLAILDRCQVEGQIVFLPDIRLDPAQYTRVNKVLEAIGGKWNRKAKGHVFAADLTEALDDALSTGQVECPNGLEFFRTPDPLVKRVIALANIQPGADVLEPSAGDGALALAAVEAGARVDAVEIDHLRVQRLMSHGAFTVYQDDFLTLPPIRCYDRVVMNPPFSKQRDIDHVNHALKFLRPGGRLVAIMSAGVASRENRKTVEFRERVSSIEANPDKAFAASGTHVSTVTVVLGAP
jgi:predicted RNA methylase